MVDKAELIALTAEQVAKALSPAQRAYMTHKALLQKPAPWAAERLMTFPPANVHRVLMRHKLVDKSGQILPFGLSVMEALAKQEPR